MPPTTSATPSLPEHFDVLVVGGGPAGLSAAQVIAASGSSVCVLERASSFGEPIRTSGGSFVKPLRALGVPKHLYQPVSELRLIGPRHDIRRRFRRSPMCVLDIRGLYQWLAAQAAAAGATLRLRAMVASSLVEEGRVVGVRLRGGEEIRAGLVIDASGTTGALAKDAGLRPTAPRTAFGLEWEVVAPAYDQSSAMLIVGDAVAPGGYAWAFPRGDARVRLGVGVVRPDSEADAQELLDNLVARVPQLASCAGAQAIEVHSGVMPAFRHDAVGLHAPGLLVVGDAAGQGSTLLGEGIRHVMVAGRLAGTHAARALGHPPGPEREHELEGYARAWHELAGFEMRVGYRIHMKVCRYRDEDWSRALDLAERMRPRLLLATVAGALTPSFAARFALTQPLLTLRAGRSLLSAARDREI